jgi:nitrate/nitrite-specific signal transduction histidine kinase
MVALLKDVRAAWAALTEAPLRQDNEWLGVPGSRSNFQIFPESTRIVCLLRCHCARWSARTNEQVQTPETFLLVENAVQHGLYSSARAGRLQLVVRPKGEWLEMSVSDDGQGVPAAEIEHLFFAQRPRVHALVLLRRRLQGLFGQSFQLEARSEIGEGTTVTMRIPLRKRFEVGLLSPRAITSDLRELAPN